MSFVGQVRPQVVDIFVTTAKYFAFFFTSQKSSFPFLQLAMWRRKHFLFFSGSRPLRLFSFPNDFRGNAEHFSKMQIQRNRCENTRAGSSPSKILEKQPNFRCSRGELGLLQHSSTMRAKNFPQKKFVRQAKILRRFQLQRRIHQKLESFRLISSPSKKTPLPISVHTRIYRCH